MPSISNSSARVVAYICMYDVCMMYVCMYVRTYQHDPGLGRAVLDHVQELGQGVHIVLHSRVEDRQVDGVLFEEQRDGVGVDRLTRGVSSGEVDLTYAEAGQVDAVGHGGAGQELVPLHAVQESGLRENRNHGVSRNRCFLLALVHSRKTGNKMLLVLPSETTQAIGIDYRGEGRIRLGEVCSVPQQLFHHSIVASHDSPY